MSSLNIVLWIFLIIFFILAVTFIFLYFSAQSYLIEPNQCPNAGANYGVVVGKVGNVVSLCPGIGTDPTSSECTFEINSLYSAINNCNNNPETCTAFLFNGTTQQFVTTPLFNGDPTATTYIKQIF